MKAIHRIFAALTLLCLGVIPAAAQAHPSAGIQSEQAAFEDWDSQVFRANFSASNISTVSVLPNNIPVIGYLLGGDHFLHYTFPAYSGIGGCGPGNTWECSAFSVESIDTSHASKMAARSFDGYFQIGWVYEWTDNDLWVLTQKYDDEFQKIGSADSHKLVDLDNAAGYIKGRPALVYDAAGISRAIYIYHINSTNRDRLMYIHYINSSNSSCGFTSIMQCDPILTLDGIGDTPMLGLNQSNDPRIAYYDVPRDRMTYAYPQSSLLMHPNCGPGDDTWRCVTIAEGTSGLIGARFDMAGSSLSEELHPFHLLYSYTNDMTSQPQLIHAHYVGSGGNCGEDYGASGALAYRWQCDAIVTYNTAPLTLWFSLQVDQNDNPVFAYATGGEVSHVAWAFPVERTEGLLEGNCGPGGTSWYCQVIFSSSIDAGNQVSLLLNHSGVGFLAFVEDREYEPYLWISTQTIHTYFPFVKR